MNVLSFSEWTVNETRPSTHHYPTVNQALIISKGIRNSSITMAASSSDTKNSPSEKPLGKSENDAAKTEDDAIPPTTEAAPAVATTVATAATAATTSTLPTYESVQASQHYTVAKTLLNNGDFEDALQTIEEGLELTRAILLSEGGLAEDEGLAVHPALGVRANYCCLFVSCVCVCVGCRERGHDVPGIRAKQCKRIDRVHSPSM
jgi:hypothetical protein